MVPHITEVMDDELKKGVFVFHAHVNQDDDRCGAKDRQRTEIRGGKLADVVASNGQTVYYRWKFKLPAGFQTSPNFTHIMQIKSDAAAPVMTLTPRGTTLSIDGIVGVRGTQPLSKFINTWVVADMKIVFGTAGHIDLKIRKYFGGETLFDYSGGADTWQGNDSGHDPKWGIYRSLNSRGDLRDEQVRFADFCISKTSAAECDDGLGNGDPGTNPPPPEPDAGTTMEKPDAGATKADTGSSPPPPKDSGTVDPDPTPTPDASTSTPKPDAGGSKPPPTTGPGTGGSGEEEPPAMEPPRKAASSGCQVGSGDAGLAGLLLLGALAFLRRRR
jgi:MYXO-CTERM domain-containing protein